MAAFPVSPEPSIEVLPELVVDCVDADVLDLVFELNEFF